MIIDFRGNTGGGGGSGTTNYNELSNKPQINNVTLSGNVSSDQLGITPNELKAVENVPSAATNGSVFSEYREDEVKYGWQYDSATGSTFIFDMTLNPFEIVTGSSWVLLCNFTYDGFSRDVRMTNEYTPDNRIMMLGVKEWQPGDSGTVQPFTGVYLNFDYTDTEHPSFTFVDGNGDPVDVVISNEIAPASLIQVTKELKQAYNQEIAISRWDKYGDEYQGRYQLYQFKPLEGFYVPRTTTFIGQVHYYDIVIKAYVNTGNTVAYMVNISVDSGETWQAYNIPSTGLEIPLSLTGSSTAKVMNATFKAEYNPAGPGGDYGYFNIEADKFMWWDDLVVLTKNVLNYDTFLKSGSSYNLLTEKPQINGVELIGNKSKSDLGLNANKLYSGARTNIVLQKEVNGTRALAWANQNDVCFSVDWDGHSDMLLSFNWDDGSETGQTAYFSGGTWFNLDNPDWYRISNGKIYFHRNNYTQLTSIAQGSLSSAVTFYKNVTGYIDGEWIDAIGDCISVYNGPSNSDYWYSFVSGASRNVKMGNVGDGNLTINYGNNIEETIEISNGNWGDTTGWTWESDHYYKYTPDMGKLMIFHYGDFYWEIRGGNGDLYINNPDVNGIVTGNIEAKEAYNKMFGLYTYNGAVWEQIK